MKKTFWWGMAILAVLLAAGAAFAAKKYFSNLAVPNGLATSGGKKMTVKIAVDPRLQRDRRWKDEELGASKETIGAVGCTLCSVSMALTSQGFDIDPQKLNRQLSDLDGFTKSGLLIWGAIPRVTKGKFQVKIEDQPTHALIDSQLAKGNPVVAKVLFKGVVWHWVLICGKEGTGYLINDPLGSGRSHENMKNYKKGIFAIRYLQSL